MGATILINWNGCGANCSRCNHDSQNGKCRSI